MVAAPNMLVVFKEDTIYGLSGNSYLNYLKTDLGGPGCIAPRSIVRMGSEVYYLARDGLRGWNGARSILLSKHVHRDTPKERGACACAYEGHYYISFPEAGHTLLFDPDTFRYDAMGDGRVSMFRHTYAVEQFVPQIRTGDDGTLKGVRNGSSPALWALYEGEHDNGAMVRMEMVTAHFRGQDGPVRRIGRVKLELATAGDYELTARADDGAREVSGVIHSGIGSGMHIETVSFPYTIDGMNVSLRLVHEGPGGYVRALHLSAADRYF
jgi:hypothetical protein